MAGNLQSENNISWAGLLHSGSAVDLHGVLHGLGMSAAEECGLVVFICTPKPPVAHCQMFSPVSRSDLLH